MRIPVIDSNGKTIELEIVDNTPKEMVNKMKPFLRAKFCDCNYSEVLCYPKDGECTCGTFKHHVHCRHCGGISQIG